MKKQEEKNKVLNTHGLLENPEIKAKFDESVKEETRQIKEKLENPPFKEEDLALFERKSLKNAHSIDTLNSQISDDVSGFKKFNPSENTDFIEKERAGILDEKEQSSKTNADEPKSKLQRMNELRNFAVSKWSNTLETKTTQWKNDTQKAMSDDFKKRMQAWFDAMLKAKELEEQSPELFGKYGLFGDAVSMVNDALDLENLGDIKYQKKVLEDLEDISDIQADKSDLEGSRGFSNDKGSLKRNSIANILRYFNMIKNNKALMDICDILGRMKDEEKEMYKEKITELTAYSYTQTTPTKRYKEEIIGVTLGNDLENIIPQEMSLLDDEDLELLFDLKFVENRLFCFEKQGFVSYQEEGQKEIEKEVEKERKKEGQKGPIIICVDTSGSMYGAPETVAKAITLMLTAKARKEKRNCYLINFSTGTVCADMSGAVGVNKINDFLELSFGGGTDVGAGLEVGVEQMEKENYKNSDLLVISDGDFGYISNSLEQKMRQKRKEKNKFYLLDVNGNSGAKRFFDKHWVYDSNSKNVRVLCEMKEEMEKKNV